MLQSSGFKLRCWVVCWLGLAPLLVSFQLQAETPARSAPAPKADGETTAETAAERAEAVQASGSAAAGSEDALSDADACFPSCRVGFLCHQGQCISACNPPCEAGYRCTAQADCALVEAPAPDSEVLDEDEDDEDEMTEHAEVQYTAKLYNDTIHRHDGFYLRLGFTLGYASSTTPDELEKTNSSGGGGFIDYAIGGTLARGLVLAFAHHTLGVFRPNTTVGGARLEEDHSALYQVLGPMLDYFPDDKEGLHFAVTLGFSDATIMPAEGPQPQSEIGFGLGLGIGYDSWFEEQWSLGGTARLLYIHGAQDDFGKHRAFIPMLALSVLYH